MTEDASDGEPTPRGTPDWNTDAERAFRTLTDHMLLGRLDVLLEAVSEVAYPAVSADYGGLPGAAGFAEDLRTFDPVGKVQQVCGTWHMVAAECLQAVCSVHQDGHIAWAPGPLLRAALEHVARIGWILDGPDPRTRAARAWLAEVVANGEDQRTHLNSGDPVPTLSDAPERLRRLCEETLPPLFGESPDRSARHPAQWTLCGQSWGTYTDVVAELFTNFVEPRVAVIADGRVQYRIASMFAHPSTTAAFSLADVSEAGSAIFRWSWDLTRLRTGIVLTAFYAVTEALYEYVGWSPPALAAWSQHLQQFVRHTNPAPDEVGEDEQHPNGTVGDES